MVYKELYMNQCNILYYRRFSYQHKLNAIKNSLDIHDGSFEYTSNIK